MFLYVCTRFFAVYRESFPRLLVHCLRFLFAFEIFPFFNNIRRHTITNFYVFRRHSVFIVVSAYYLCSFRFKAAQPLPWLSFSTKSRLNEMADCVTMENKEKISSLITSHLVCYIFCALFFLVPLHEWITRKTSESRRRQMRYLWLKWDNKNSFGVVPFLLHERGLLRTALIKNGTAKIWIYINANEVFASMHNEIKSAWCVSGVFCEDPRDWNLNFVF